MSAQKSTSGILGINTVAEIEFANYYPTVSIVHRGATGVLWIRTDGVNPVIAAPENYPVLPGERVTYVNGNLTSDPNVRVINGTQVLMISDTAIPYTVYCF